MMVHDNQNHEYDQMSGYDKSLGIVCSEVQLDYTTPTFKGSSTPSDVTGNGLEDAPSLSVSISQIAFWWLQAPAL